MMKDPQVFEGENEAKDVADFMKTMERRWPRATPKERNQMRRDFIALMQKGRTSRPAHKRG
jgi:hypothetical protein